MVAGRLEQSRRGLAIVAVGALLALVMVLGVGRQAWAAAGTFQLFTYSGPTGSRPYAVYTPAGYTTSARVPLVVMLHGCGQNPIDFAAGTGMDDLADTKQFVVAYPQQTAADEYQLCWHFFDPSSQSRGSGEAAIIAGITQTVMADSTHWNIDPQKVYVAGFSAGAAMAVNMGATYPDLYAAIGVSAGVEYKAATNSQSADFANHGGPDPVAQGQLAYSAMGTNARVLPVIVFHGTADSAVAPVNGDQVVQQWMETDHLASSSSYSPSFNSPAVTTSGVVPGGRAYTVRQWNDAGGTEVQEYWTITGMDHAWSGGSTAGNYTDPSGPNASQNIYTFFMAHPLSGPPATAPPAPTGLTASAASSSQINLSWTAASGATGYEIQRSADGTTGWTEIGTSSITTYNDGGLTPSTQFYYRVVATNAVGSSPPSGVASAMTLPAPPSLTVSGLSGATAGTAQTVTVTAMDASGAVATGYSGTVTFSSSDKQASLPADYTFVPADGGVHSFAGGVSLNTAGAQTVTATDTANTSVTGSQTVTVSPGPFNSLALVPGSATMVAGGSQSYTAGGFDQYGNSLGDVTAGTAFNIAPDGSCTGAICTATVAGVHAVTGTYSGKTATASLNVIAAAASQLILTAPSSATASQSFQVTVTVRDQYGNVATGYTGTVRFTSSDPLASVNLFGSGSYTFTAADAGTRNFSVTLLTAGNQTITVTDAADSSLTDTKTVTVGLLLL